MKIKDHLRLGFFFQQSNKKSIEILNNVISPGLIFLMMVLTLI